MAQTVKNPPAMQKTWVWSLRQEDPLEKGMVAHSSVLAWRIPWTDGCGQMFFLSQNGDLVLISKRWNSCVNNWSAPSSLLWNHVNAYACGPSFSHVQLSVTPWTVACQAPLSMGFSRQEYWSGLPLPSPPNLPDPGIELSPLTPHLLQCQAYSLPPCHFHAPLTKREHTNLESWTFIWISSWELSLMIHVLDEEKSSHAGWCYFDYMVTNLKRDFGATLSAILFSWSIHTGVLWDEDFLSSAQFGRSVLSDSLWPHELPHARPPCPSPTPGVHRNSCPFSRWYHPTISSSVTPCSCPQSFPASGSLQMSQLFAAGGQSIDFLSPLKSLISFTFSWPPGLPSPRKIKENREENVFDRQPLPLPEQEAHLCPLTSTPVSHRAPVVLMLPSFHL